MTDKAPARVSRRVDLRVILIIVGVSATGAAGSVLAHGDHDWIRVDNFRNPITGEHCCGEHDCAVVPASDVEVEPGGWRILSTGERIPDRETLRSKDGRFWRCHQPNGTRRCFFAPPGTS